MTSRVGKAGERDRERVVGYGLRSKRWSRSKCTILNASRCGSSGCWPFTFATSAFMKTLYALRARGGAFTSFSTFRFLLLFPDEGWACGVKALGWICTAKTALHSLHCTDVMPSGRRTCRCAEQLGHVTWNHCAVRRQRQLAGVRNKLNSVVVLERRTCIMPAICVRL